MNTAIAVECAALAVILRGGRSCSGWGICPPSIVNHIVNDVVGMAKTYDIAHINDITNIVYAAKVSLAS